MYPTEGYGVIFWALVFLNTIWLVGISILVWQNERFCRKVFPNKRGDFREKFEEILSEIRWVRDFKKQTDGYFQKMALKRYNPYEDTGGNQSFSISILDGKNNGVVITSLHSRVGTRVFAKPVKGGKEENFQFSQEEKEVIEQAKSFQD